MGFNGIYWHIMAYHGIYVNGYGQRTNLITKLWTIFFRSAGQRSQIQPWNGVTRLGNHQKFMNDFAGKIGKIIGIYYLGIFRQAMWLTTGRWLLTRDGSFDLWHQIFGWHELRNKFQLFLLFLMWTYLQYIVLNLYIYMYVNRYC